MNTKRLIGIVLGIFILFASASTVSGQRGARARAAADAEKQKDEIFNRDDPDFKVTEVPDKWKDESAVIIAQKATYEYKRKNKRIVMEEEFHRRIILLDKAAVEEFSKFYFTSSSQNSIGIKQVKPDGTVIDVDLSGAVEDENAPNVFRSYYYYREKYLKLAIPDLEAGDILDYYFKSEEAAYGAYSHHFASFHFTLGKKYPIMKQRFDFTVDRGFYISFNSYNGAPDLAEGAAGTDARGRVRETIKTYFFEDEDREAIRDEKWSYPLAEFPSIKFKVHYLVPKDKNNPGIIKGEGNEVKTVATADEICAVAASNIRGASYRGSLLADETVKYLRSQKIDGSDPVRLADAIYGQLRYAFVNRIYGNREGASTDERDLTYIRDDIFVNAMVTTLGRYNVGVKALAFAPRSLGKASDILLASEISLACKVGDRVFMPYNNMSNPSDNYYYSQGVEAYSFTYTKNPRALNSKPLKMPVQTPAENLIETKITGIVDESLENIAVTQKKSLQGNSRFDYAIVLRGSDYFASDRVKYDPKYKGIERGSVKARAEADRVASGRVSDRVDELNEVMEEFTEERYGELEEYGDLTLVSDGREMSPDAALVYSDKFVLTEKINKAGRNYLLDIGSLMGEQNSIDEKQNKLPRQSRVEFSYPLAVNYSISVTLPDGYTAEGLDALNIDSKTEVGELVSSAQLNGNTIELEIQKKYLKHSMDKERWDDFKKLINSSFDLSQKKVVIKKK